MRLRQDQHSALPRPWKPGLTVGYFANGTEGAIYEEHYCMRCIHYGPEDGPGCPIWFAHLLYAYDECNSDSNAKAMLDMLIPIEPGGYRNLQCTMFVEEEK